MVQLSSTDFQIERILKSAMITLKPHILFYSNGLATWYGFPDLRILNSYNCWTSTIFNCFSYYAYRGQQWPQVGHFRFDLVEICHCISPPETTHFVQYNVLAIWHGFPVITSFEFIRCIIEMNIKYKFWSAT